jgi:hypothetical protein
LLFLEKGPEPCSSFLEKNLLKMFNICWLGV